jgi:hypothetical protein
MHQELGGRVARKEWSLESGVIRDLDNFIGMEVATEHRSNKAQFLSVFICLHLRPMPLFDFGLCLFIR